jgi:hypothetical protein
MAKAVKDKFVLPSQVVVPADKWSALLKLKAERSALDKAVKALSAEIGLPDAETLAQDVVLPIVNGNGDHVGKLSCYWYGGATIPAAWRTRVS